MYQRRGRGRGYYQKPKKIEPEIPTSSTVDTMYVPSFRIQHTDNCCGGITINLDLEYEDQIFFDKLKQLWKMLKKSPPVINLFMNYFQSEENPYQRTIQLIYNCQDFHSAKAKSLPFFIIEQFSVFVKENQRVRHRLTPELKLNAYKVMIKQSTTALTKLVVETFEMISNGEIFMDLINCMLNNKQYREACQSIMYFGLQEYFSIEDFLVPIIFQDKLFLLDDYLPTCPNHQKEIISYLDNLLGVPSIRQIVIDFSSKHCVPEIKWEKLQSKPIKKLIARLMKRFDLPSDITPNLNKRRNAGTLQFLLQKRYIEETFSDESWKEMIQEAVSDDPELHRELVLQVASYGDFGEALKWAEFYNIDREHWPPNVKIFAKDGKVEIEPTESQADINYSWDEVEPTVHYYKFPLPDHKVHLIDCANTFQKFLNIGLMDVDIVGIDCEWKPSFGGQKSELALMQIATRTDVYILDVITLTSNVPSAWNALDMALFNRSDVLKLGFGFKSDLAMIRDSIPGLNFNSKQIGFLDLLSLWKQFDKYPELVLPFVQSGGPSLSSLVHHCLGAPLDKSEQFSNWEKRPLRNSQIIYAALDAFCLIEVYDVMKDCCEKKGFQFEEISYNLMTSDAMSKKKTKKNIKKESLFDTPQPLSHIDQEISADKIKLVCDTMLQGLGKKLRRVGIDTIILENNQDHMECARIAEKEERYILTRGVVFNKLVGKVSPGFCYKVISDDLDVQLREVVNYYKIKVKNCHVFSRCQSCNGNIFMKMENAIMKKIVANKFERNYSYEPDLDEATGFSSDEDFDDYDEPGIPIGYKKSEINSAEKVNQELCMTTLGVQIQIEGIPDDILKNVDLFYICENCGKVYWDGTHFERVVHGSLLDILQ